MHKAKSELQVKSKRISNYKAKSQKNTAEASQNKPKPKLKTTQGINDEEAKNKNQV